MANTLSAREPNYTIRKHGDNYALCFQGLVVGIFTTREAALKHKRIAVLDYLRSQLAEEVSR
jgi:hypothetical protein